MKSTRVIGLSILAVTVVAACIWFAALREDRHGRLTVSFLDIGQGDSIYIESPTGVQVLIDGGPDSTVLRRLNDVMPWYDRSIDLVVGTHPDADHISGLIDVFSRYRVTNVMQSSVVGATETWNVFEKHAYFETPRLINAARGQVIGLGGGAFLQVLFPDRAVPNLETNTACVVTRLVYKNTAFMLSCDAPKSIEQYLVELDKDALRADVLKPGHHGSKNSTSAGWVESVAPKFAVFSRGCDNKYGHPNQETIDTLTQFHVPIFDTCRDGTVTFVSDGIKVFWQNDH